MVATAIGDRLPPRSQVEKQTATRAASSTGTAVAAQRPEVEVLPEQRYPARLGPNTHYRVYASRTSLKEDSGRSKVPRSARLVYRVNRYAKLVQMAEGQTCCQTELCEAACRPLVDDAVGSVSSPSNDGVTTGSTNAQTRLGLLRGPDCAARMPPLSASSRNGRNAWPGSRAPSCY